MGVTAFLKLLYESKLVTAAPGWAAIAILGYVEFFQLAPLQAQVTGVKEAVADLQRSEYETKLDAAYAALCMRPGDAAILERIRELQQQYEKIVGRPYAQPSCDLLIKLK